MPLGKLRALFGRQRPQRRAEDVQRAPAHHQLNAVLRRGRRLGARVLPIYGGQPIGRQLRELDRGVDVVVATPGRAIDHLNRGTLTLDAVEVVVLDEADEMLDMGFAEDIESILEQTPSERQTVLFSATLPPRIDAIAARHLRTPLRIQVGMTKGNQRTLTANPNIRQTAYVVHRAHKAAALGRILDVETPAAALVFCRTRDEVDQLTETMNGRGYRAEALHGGMSQEQRDRVMGRLRSGTADYGVCIHEGRFTWQSQGLHLIEDLGQRWEQETGAPLPLGGIVARHRLGEVARTVQQVLRDSLQYARRHPDETYESMRRYAQEFDDAVLMAHVDLYVNQWTWDLGSEGEAALAALDRLGRAAGAVAPEMPPLRIIGR